MVAVARHRDGRADVTYSSVMSFTPGSRLDSSQVSRGSRRRGGTVAIGGGAGIVVLLIGAFLFGPEFALQQLTGGDAGLTTGTVGEDDDLANKCRTGADANEDVECRVVGTVNSLNAFWAEDGAAALGVDYRMPQSVLTGGTWDTGCGTGSSAMGPFYCPADETAYFDVDFFDELRNRYGADAGSLPEEYVVAHEFGHHVQHLTGVLSSTRDGQTGPQSNAVRVELQADCYAGAWAANAATVPDPQTGVPFLEPLTRADVEAALSAAEAIGDDRIQETAQGRVTPENFTHGSAEQRMRWFATGYDSGDPGTCDTFEVPEV